MLPIAVPFAGCNELVLCAYKPCLMMLDWIVLGSLQSAILDNTAKNATTQRGAANARQHFIYQQGTATNNSSPGVQNGHGCVGVTLRQG